MIQELLIKEESKTLEFKRDTSSLLPIAHAVVSFANTSGGTIVIGVEDKTKKIIGLTSPLEDEMKIVNFLTDKITPFFRPNVEIQSYRGKALILIHVPYSVGPYYIKNGEKKVVYVRFGSTNRIADDRTIKTIEMLATNISFDEMPCYLASKNGLDWQIIEDTFNSMVGKKITEIKAKSLGIFSTHVEKNVPSNGGILLFGKDRSSVFPDAIIRCVKFAGVTRGNSVDHIEIDEHLPNAIDAILYFIKKNSFTKTKIGEKRRISQEQYPPVAVREAVINAIIHTDYTIAGSSIIVALFDDRMEITNPGSLPFGLSLDDAIAGSSRARNRVIAKTFHQLELIEQWGSGLQKIIQSCAESNLVAPKFEELGSQFRVTLFAEKSKKATRGKKTNAREWQKDFANHLNKVKQVSSQEAAVFWGTDTRTARRRLKTLFDHGVIAKIGVSKHDPLGKYTLK